jgi:hypothetical protein
VEDQNPNKANEPVSPYGKRLVIDNSLEGQENDNYYYWISLTPEQRLAGVTKMMEAMYRSGISTKKDNRIYFDSE